VQQNDLEVLKLAATHTPAPPPQKKAQHNHSASSQNHRRNKIKATIRDKSYNIMKHITIYNETYETFKIQKRQTRKKPYLREYSNICHYYLFTSFCDPRTNTVPSLHTKEIPK
jgi:hypothetical protein